MKVLVSTDMEGCSGIVDFEHINAGASNFERARHYFTHDVNAAVQGCVDAGADEIIVTDSHNLQLNIIFEDLHPAAQVIMGGHIAHRGKLVMETLDSSFDLALLVGYHAAAHYPGGVLSHSYFLPANFFEVRINGQPVGETEIGAALAGAAGVPCGLIVSDDVTVQEALKLLPDMESVITKWALDRYAARCLPLQKTGPLIQEGARRACERAAAGEFTPWTFDPPLTLEITCSNYGLANKLAAVPGTDRLDNRVIGFSTSDYFQMYEALLTYCYVTMSSGEPTEALE